jgi:hypothetical protein
VRFRRGTDPPALAAAGLPGEHAAMSSSSVSFRGFSRTALVVSLCVAVAAGCDSCCTEELVKPTVEPVCVLDKQCAEGDAFRYGTCDVGGCSSDADCCPGSRCRTDLNACFPRLLDGDYECETSADCPDPAQTCATVSVGGRDPLPTCIYEPCVENADCGFGRVCYVGHCITSTPCDGGCPEGSVCELTTNSCHELPTDGRKDDNNLPGVDASCTKPCDNGLLVLADEATMTGEVCCALACECRTLPPIVPTRIGRYARVAVADEGALVSAYDAEFGDLVVVRHDKDGNRTAIDYVDGVPSVVATADPNGPRQGIRDEGPDVGTHTSIAVDAEGLARVAYHDVDGNALKVALETAPRQWTVHSVDAGDAGRGQTGTFTDIVVTPSGRVVVAYLAHDTELAGVTGAATGLKIARSRSATPRAAADWELFTVDARPFVVDPALRDESAEFPRGRGLHASLALDGEDAVVAYYDATDGDVRVARLAGANVSVAVVDGDGAAGHLSGDIGRFPTLAVRGADLFVVYEDFTRHTLRFWKGPKATPGTGGTYDIADQLREPLRSGSHFVGAGARLDASGAKPVLVYQDASTLDLRFSTFAADEFTPQTVLSDGAHGFYTDVAVAGGRAFVCSVVAELDPRGKERSQLRLDVQQLP